MKGQESWPTLADAALHGLPGDVVRAVDPHTEADPVAVLASLLAAFGGACGRGAHVRVGPTAHHLNIFAALVGPTSKGRKGTSWECVRDLMQTTDGEWADERIVNGLSSGEGLIHAVRDATVYRDKNGDDKVDDEGVQDKRLLVLEPKLASTLKVASRQGNIVTAIIRQAFDGEKLQTLTRNNPQKATGAHVSIIGHITRSELLRYLTETEAANGFANRFLWIMVRRSKELPFGGRWDEVCTAALVGRLKAALAFGSSDVEIAWGDDAKELWVRVYGPLSEGGQGMLGAVTSRAEAQVVRLSALYAAMDRSREIGAGHLKAALALWDCAEDSARYIFGDATGDPVADRIHEALKAAPEGMTRTQISNLLGRHRDSVEVDRALQTLLTGGRARKEQEATGGRAAERWFAA
jgi:hypothetical protein